MSNPLQVPQAQVPQVPQPPMPMYQAPPQVQDPTPPAALPAANQAVAAMPVPRPAVRPYPMTTNGAGHPVFPQLYGYAGLPASGPWSFHEHRLFEQGCIMYGWGNWKKIQEAIPGRTKDQCKSHGQKFLKNHSGEKERLISEHRKLLNLQNDNNAPEGNSKKSDRPSKKKATKRADNKKGIKKIDKPEKKLDDVPAHVPYIAPYITAQNTLVKEPTATNNNELPQGEGWDKKEIITSDSIDTLCNDISERKLKGQLAVPCAKEGIDNINNTFPDSVQPLPLHPVAGSDESKENNLAGAPLFGGLIEAIASLEDRNSKSGGTTTIKTAVAAPLEGKRGETKSGDGDDAVFLI